MLSLAAIAISYFNLFGQERDPLSAIPLVLLGQPWVRFLDPFPEPWRPWLAGLTPVLNLIILAGICRAVFSKQP